MPTLISPLSPPSTMTGFSLFRATARPVAAFLAAAATALGAWMPAHATEPEVQVFVSGAARVTLLELYTSEGCSSCPPADRWLGQLRADPRLWRELVPIAFHVDYWDYIGWPDRFATAEYGTRQQVYRAQGHLRTVYTPGLVVGGREWRGWFSNPTLELNAAPAAGSLEVRASGRTVVAEFNPGRPFDHAPILNVALLGFDLHTPVKAGENRGRKLEHQFVVLGYARVPMDAGASGTLSAATELPAPSAESPRLALAAWVEQANDQTPLQAVGGWLD
ncbi:MAG: DUF1223 domain-containing protein [Gammaproteobacteria bacterium]